MIHRWIAVAAVLGSTSAAQAQSWTGFYIGANAQGSRDRVAADATLQIGQISGLFVTGRGIVIVPGTTRNFAASRHETNWSGGAQLGYQWQSANVVFGAEADFDPFHRNLSVAQSQPLPPTAITPATTIASVRDVRLDQAWTARARLGIAFGGTLAYATGGYGSARARVTSIDSFTNPGGPAAPCAPAPCQANLGPEGPVVTTASARHRMGGWTGGIGLEQQLGAHFSLGLEYRHSDLGSHNFAGAQTTVNTGPETHGDNGGTGLLGQVSTGPTHVSLRTDALSLRLNFHF
jgi:outer membrane immunogenic protein